MEKENFKTSTLQAALAIQLGDPIYFKTLVNFHIQCDILLSLFIN